ncbi:thioredoxin family protein [Acidovorax sp. LjRoot118]|uniref:thioredoxin family protein n=1 Tax=Acidovorax sp. LjRoot118 TaxID=3342256 RepID=UPI00119AC77C
MANDRIIAADPQGLKSQLQGNGLVLVDFWAAWCAPCRVVAPMLDRLVGEFPGVRVVKIDAETHKEVLDTYGVRSLPTLQLYSDSRKVDQLTGKVQYEMIRRAVGKAAQ